MAEDLPGRSAGHRRISSSGKKMDPPLPPVRIYARMVKAASKSIHPKARLEWHSWLGQHVTQANGVWLIRFKKASGKPRKATCHRSFCGSSPNQEAEYVCQESAYLIVTAKTFQNTRFWEMGCEKICRMVITTLWL